MFYPTDCFSDELSRSSSESESDHDGPGTIWDIDLVRMANQLTQYRVDRGMEEPGAQALPRSDSRPGDDGAPLDVKTSQGESQEQRQEVLSIIRARVTRVLRQVYFR